MTRPKNSPRRKILGLALLLLMASLPTLGGQTESYETDVNGNAATCCEPFPGEADLYPSVAPLPRISLTWHDPHHRISSRLESMFREVKDIFRRAGVDAVRRFPGKRDKSAGGLMSSKQTRATLLMRRTTLDAACGRALLTALELWAKGTR